MLNTFKNAINPADLKKPICVASFMLMGCSLEIDLDARFEFLKKLDEFDIPFFCSELPPLNLWISEECLSKFNLAIASRKLIIPR